MSPLTAMKIENLKSLVCRRDLLKVGPLALSASVMPGLLGGAARGEFTPNPTAKAKSVIFLWMGGGVTHIDSLDPKPEAPEHAHGEARARVFSG